MIDRIRLHLALALSTAAAACGTFVNSENQKRLASYQGNAQTYYEGRRYDQAEDQVRKGLEIDAKDYKLNLILGWIHLQRAQGNPAWLRESRTQFEKTLSLRSSSVLTGETHLGYAMCLQREAQADLAEARKITTEADSGVLPAADAQKRRERAAQMEKRAADGLKLAREHLEIIIQKGDLLDLAHYHMAQIATLQKDTLTARQHGQKFLERIAARTKLLNTRVEKTYDADKEAAWRESLRDLKVKEIEVNGLLANVSYKDNDFEQTVQYLDRVLDLDPTRTADWFNRARCHCKLKAWAKAKSDVEQFLRLSSSFDDPAVKEAMDLRRSIAKELAK